ncbi:response regulator transcription factor [Mesorhizobium sp. M2D.F.Ca.ET.185.01.1.1]|uniref:response regulator transcription factor n=1 Tax=unclassified Mesorhizobium TaxID=325217 RepID=UPI000FCABC8A|nr:MULTISPECIES: response regulator transcription factor [unclassified Mesorhizobium]TGP52740.1 response regulator transcription factor [bacterium M00.F.Ca.ET.230.01.1.1]TGP80990.1 response regulator transcription factor [bacterium M00.F.Ca.ET.227.01.1.1]TGP90773.1 response regulator transcription factor [bacterium M00.F.Ca.ET.221.01.1.1]TGP97452.1 response regulator transcription factor [bacterium M00.F.Ca.ET.222.01.1.1]TGT75983.1 response regulator transcription factor [bacterium M00.F.Ca.ET
MNQPLPGGHWGKSIEVDQNDPALHLGGASLAETQEGHRGDSLVVIVDKRILERECLASSLLSIDPVVQVRAVGSFLELQDLQAEASAILAILNGKNITDPIVRSELQEFIALIGAVPVIVVADSEAPADILTALESGARGYIPTNVSVKVAAEAISLARAGGIFVPANAVLALRETIRAAESSPKPLAGVFTSKEAAVVEALRKGKANKIIAYELNLCESTVKVHIRNIMKKLKATNRTEVAYKLRDLM